MASLLVLFTGVLILGLVNGDGSNSKETDVRGVFLTSDVLRLLGAKYKNNETFIINANGIKTENKKNTLDIYLLGYTIMDSNTNDESGTEQPTNAKASLNDTKQVDDPEISASANSSHNVNIENTNKEGNLDPPTNQHAIGNVTNQLTNDTETGDDLMELTSSLNSSDINPNSNQQNGDVITNQQETNANQTNHITNVTKTEDNSVSTVFNSSDAIEISNSNQNKGNQPPNQQTIPEYKIKQFTMYKQQQFYQPTYGTHQLIYRQQPYPQNAVYLNQDYGMLQPITHQQQQIYYNQQPYIQPIFVQPPNNAQVMYQQPGKEMLPSIPSNQQLLNPNQQLIFHQTYPPFPSYQPSNERQMLVSLQPDANPLSNTPIH